MIGLIEAIKCCCCCYKIDVRDIDKSVQLYEVRSKLQHIAFNGVPEVIEVEEVKEEGNLDRIKSMIAQNHKKNKRFLHARRIRQASPKTRAYIATAQTFDFAWDTVDLSHSCYIPSQRAINVAVGYIMDCNNAFDKIDTSNYVDMVKYLEFCKTELAHLESHQPINPDLN